MYHIFFIYSSVDEHLGCFHVLAVVSSPKMTEHWGVCIFWNYDFLWELYKTNFYSWRLQNKIKKWSVRVMGWWINRNSVSCQGNLIVTICWSVLILFKEVFLFFRVFSEFFFFWQTSLSVLFQKPSESFRRARGLSMHGKS